MKEDPGTVPDSPSSASGDVRPSLPGGEYGSPAERYSFRDRGKKRPTLPPSATPDDSKALPETPPARPDE